jgi:hypothetical protein
MQKSPIIDGYGLLHQSYEEYLGSEWWEDRKERALYHWGGICNDCGWRKAVDVHHLRYWQGGESVLGREDVADIIPLCRRCHMERHNNWGMGA